MAQLSDVDVRTALLRGEIQPFYQPLVDLRSGATTGFEILARWRHPAGGITPPTVFIPLAESSGLICELTRQLLKEAFCTVAELPGDFGLSVNISPIQLRNRTLPITISSLAALARFSLKRLTVEITESALLTNHEVIRRTAGELKEMGIKLALDDFGTGYSNLRHLQALDFDELKVDRSFVRAMMTERESRKIVSAVIGLGRSLGMRTVAEGIEEQSQADMLLCLGCELGQGWLYGKAGPAKVLEKHTQTPARPTHTEAETASDPILCLQAIPTQGPAQLQAIYDGAPVGLCFLDCNLRYVNLNRRLAEMNGRSVQSHLGRTVEQAQPRIFAQVKEYLHRALQGEAIGGVEVTVPPADPDLPARTLLLTYQPARDEAGDVVGISVAVVDISDRKRAEEALRESEDHYRHMVELNPQIPWTTDRSGKNIEISPRWKDLTGQTAAQTQGNGWMRVLHPDDLPKAAAVWFQAVQSGEAFDLEFRVKNNQGGWSWVRSRSAPRRDAGGQIIRWYGSTECIDEQKRYAEELQASAARLQAVIDTVPVGIVIAEAPSGRIISRNPAVTTILRQDPIQFSNMDDYARCVNYFRDGHPLQAHEFPLAKALLYGASTQADEVLYRSADGTEKRIRLSGGPLRDPNGTIIGAVASIEELAPPGRGTFQDFATSSPEQLLLNFLALLESLALVRVPCPFLQGLTSGTGTLSSPRSST